MSDYVIQYIEKLGVKDVFLLSGGGCMHLVDSLGKNQKVNYKCCLFEQVVSLAAGAYAQY
ncbi:MAG: thiamine pyrophosphate-binding protein, partial [Lachnospiraceae bacterium]